MNDQQIRALAGRLKRMGSTADPLRLCELLGIEVVETPLPSALRGFFTTVLGSKIIVLNTDLPQAARQMTCAHELGHALLHEGINTLEMQSLLPLHPSWQYEREADLFAACVLISEDELPALLDCPTYTDTASALGVSEELLRLYCEAFPCPGVNFAG